jgi:hypothetical protein
MRRPNGVPAAPVAAASTQEPPPQAELLERVVEATARERYSLQEVQYMAKAASQSKMFGMSESQAFVLMMLCEADGLHPMEAVRRFDINEYGKVSPKSVFVHAEMLRLGWRIELVTATDDDKKARFIFAHPTKPVVAASVTWGEQDARRAGLIDKPNYEKWAPDMFRSKAILRGARLNEPGIFVGVQDAEDAIDDAEAPKPERPIRRMDDLSTYVEGPASPVPEPDSQTPDPTWPETRSEPPTQTPRGECSAWIQWQIDEVENEWASICAKAKKPHAPLGEKGKRLNVWQVINGVVSDWLEDDPPLIEPDSVNTDGKRDRAKVLEIIRHQWSADDDGDGLMDDVRQYLREKLETAAKANGINLDAEPEEVTADA